MREHGLAGIAIIYAMIIVGLISAKLVGHIAWAWWIVLLPIWAPILVIVVLALIMIVGLGAAVDRGENPFQ